MKKMSKLCAALLLALWLALGCLAPASADGPIIPGYLINSDGQRVPAPAAYIHAGAIGGERQACGPFSSPQDLFWDARTGNLLVADTGNNRVIVLSGDGRLLLEIGGQAAGFNAPQGVFVDAAGNIWVADTNNQRVVEFAADGRLKAEYRKPDSDYLADFSFRPAKLVVDQRGFIYVAAGSEDNLGVLVMDGAQRFRGFFGRTRIQFDLGRVMARLLASQAQRRRMLSAQPAPLRNLYLDAAGFIYAVSPVLARDQIQRLNSVGENIYGEVGTRTGAGRLWDKLTGNEGIAFGESEVKWSWDERRNMSVPYTISANFVDVAVDELGTVSVIDGQRNQIYQYDQAGNLLAIFGGSGMSAGSFAQPVSIVAGPEGRLYVLDARRGNIQIFRPTATMRLIHQASHEYFDGRYGEAAVLWNEIAQRNTNFALAHVGLGKALMRQGQYPQAMQEYRYAENQDGYSAAFGEYRYVWMRAHFEWLGLGVIGLLIAANLGGTALSRGSRRSTAAMRDWRQRSGLWAVPVLLLLAVAARMASLMALSYHFQEQRPEETRLLFESGKVLIPWITWCISALAVGEIFYGEGTFRRIAISSAWALWPFIVLTVPLNLMTNLITRDEKVMWDIGQVAMWGLMAWQFFQVVKTEHKFETRQTVVVMGLILLGMAIIWVLLGLVYALSGEIVQFVRQIALELYVRQY
jgi:DNA-binding beta-propeller fold protein YncE